MSPPAPDGVTLVMPVTAATAAAASTAVPRWLDALVQLRRDHALILVDDGCPPDAALALETLAAGRPQVILLRHPSPGGFGACLKTALPHATLPLVCTVGLDYPYTPADLKAFLERIALPDAVLHVPPALVAGCRTGRPVPAAWRAVGVAFRLFSRVALGYPTDPLPGWLGLRTHWRAWRAWLVYGNPLTDPDCSFQLVRREALGQFPVQSDGGFVHMELVAKLTFLTQILDEVPLTPKPEPVPPCDWADSGRIFRDPHFHPPAVPLVDPAAAPAPAHA